MQIGLTSTRALQGLGFGELIPSLPGRNRPGCFPLPPQLPAWLGGAGGTDPQWDTGAGGTPWQLDTVTPQPHLASLNHPRTVQLSQGSSTQRSIPITVPELGINSGLGKHSWSSSDPPNTSQ